jgi:pimeloyl-ACP methyl ester carboxylesterase
MTFVLDRLDEIEAAVPPLSARLDRDRIAVVGHSMGGHTASALLGARFDDPNDGSPVRLVEPRIKAGVVIAGPAWLEARTGSPRRRRLNSSSSAASTVSVASRATTRQRRPTRTPAAWRWCSA